MYRLNTSLLAQFATSCRLQWLIGLHETARDGPLSLKGGLLSLDEQHHEPPLEPCDYYHIYRHGRQLPIS
jgi:hypothetical protein